MTQLSYDYDDDDHDDYDDVDYDHDDDHNDDDVDDDDGNDHDDYDDDHNDGDYDACICAYLPFIATADNDNYFGTAYRLAGKRSLPFSSSSRLTSSDSDVDGSSSSSSSSSSYQGMYCIISTVTIYHSSLLNSVNLSP